MPVNDDHGNFRGVAAMDIQLTKITELINTIRVGETGYAFLIDREGHVIAMSEKGYQDFGLTADDIAAGTYLENSLLPKVSIELFGVMAKMTSSQNGIGIITLGNTEKYIAYHPVLSVGYSLGVVVEVGETQRNVMKTEEQLEVNALRTILNLTGTMAIIWIIFLLVSRSLGNALTKPLAALTANARLIARGELVNVPSSDSGDEVGLLTNTLATMTNNLRATIGATEQRVIERTAELRNAVAESEKRAQELKTISEVARTVSTEIELETLLNTVTYLVSERFGFYHVGVFLVDAVTKYAILRAANSPGGKRMLERGHKLEVGREGIVGYVTGTGEARIALDVGEDAVYFDNPDMPNTRSEMALPLKLRGRIIGALDVQSVEPNAFKADDVDTLGILADQIAIAIDNARLFAETQRTLSEVQSLYGEYVGRTWSGKTSKTPIGYHHSAGGGQTLMEPVEWEEAQDALVIGKTLVTANQADSPASISAVAVPIRLYNQTIGVIDVRSADPSRQWREDEIAVIEATAERLALALENARLFEETSARASREHAVAEITSKIRGTNDPQAMIRIAIEELKRVLNVTRVEIIPQVVQTPPAGSERSA
jgi:GAF domain-containing protein/HAMP domain-containing protein